MSIRDFCDTIEQELELLIVLCAPACQPAVLVRFER